MNQLSLFACKNDSELTDENIFSDIKNFDWLKGHPYNLQNYFREVIPRLEKIGRQDLVLDAEKR